METAERKSLWVTQSNVLVEACYKMTLEEMRMIISAISKIDSRKRVPDKITIAAEDYAEQWGLNINAVYQQLNDAAERLWERSIKFNTVDEKGKPVIHRMRWVCEQKIYHEREGKVTISFTPGLHPYLGELQKEYTKYQQIHIRDIKSWYTLRLYQLLVRFQNTEEGERWILLEKLREQLEVGDSYPRFADLKRWVIEPSVNELNKTSNLVVSYQVEKHKRAVHKIWFFFEEKKQMSMFDA